MSKERKKYEVSDAMIDFGFFDIMELPEKRYEEFLNLFEVASPILMDNRYIYFANNKYIGEKCYVSWHNIREITNNMDLYYLDDVNGLFKKMSHEEKYVIEMENMAEKK